MYDASLVLNKEKRIFKAISGVELDVTYKPYILNILTAEYFNLHTKAAEALKKHLESPSERTIDDVLKTSKSFMDCGMKIIIAALKANKAKHSTEEWVTSNLVAEEFNLLVQYIIGSVTEENTEPEQEHP